MEVDFPPVPRQNSACSTHALEHRIGQRRVGFLARLDRRLLVRTCPLTPVRIIERYTVRGLEQISRPFL